LKQFETRDQTRKGAKIKGSNYNSSGGLDYKIIKTAKDRIENIHFEILKRRRFLKEHYSLSPSNKAVFRSKTGIRFAANCSNYGAHFMAAIPLSPDYKATITTAGLSLAYKSQRKTVKKEGRRTGEIKGKQREGKRFKVTQKAKKTEGGRNTGGQRDNEGRKQKRQREKEIKTREECKEERGRGRELEERKQRDGETNRGERDSKVRKRDTDRRVEPPSALFSSRTKEIPEEATITTGFTFFRTREPAEEASITIGFSFSRITNPAEQHNHQPPFSKTSLQNEGNNRGSHHHHPLHFLQNHEASGVG
jgi:hypothetical protein